MTTRILAFCGSIGSGKDTCCKFLCGSVGVATKMIPEFSLAGSDLIIGDKVSDENSIHPKVIKNYKFATPMKEFVIDVLGLDPELVYGTQADKQTPTHIKWEDFPGIITNKHLYNSIRKHVDRKFSEHSKFRTKFALEYHEPGFMTVREVLQWFGTEIVRKMHGSAWVDATMNKIQRESPKFALVSDARFLNEFDAIKKAGGALIKLTRNTSPSEHASELDFNRYTNFDYIINNDQDDIMGLVDKVKVAVTKLDYFK